MAVWGWILLFSCSLQSEGKSILASSSRSQWREELIMSASVWEFRNPRKLGFRLDVFLPAGHVTRIPGRSRDPDSLAWCMNLFQLFPLFLVQSCFVICIRCKDVFPLYLILYHIHEMQIHMLDNLWGVTIIFLTCNDAFKIWDVLFYHEMYYLILCSICLLNDEQRKGIIPSGNKAWENGKTVSMLYFFSQYDYSNIE